MYIISHTLFHKTNGTHLSNCKSYVEGENYEDALRKLEKEQSEKGWIVAFAVEGEMFQLTLNKEWIR